ncbi:MAG TPA: hypothetical protein VGL81_08115 [Polyangiaceae bacterium]
MVRLVGFPLLLSCNSAASGTIQIITGEETDTFTQTPVPTQILVQAADTSGNLTTLATAPYPTDTIDLGNQDQDAVASLLVTAEDANGNALVYGGTIPLQYGALDGETLPVFVQRMGQNARLPNPPTDARQFPVLGVLSDRFLIVAGGSDPTVNSTTQVYDFAQFNLLAGPPTLPIVPASMPIMGTVALLLDTAGDGNFYDFSQNTGTSVSPPTGFAFSDVAGGQVVYDNYDGYIFVVGGTRLPPLAATAAVLKIDTTDLSNSLYPYGNLSWLTLSAQRLGASAAFVDGPGLVVAGGNATAPGVETVANGSNGGATLPYPPDPSTGAGMTNLDDVENVLIAGGVMPDGTDAGVRYVNVRCGSCAVVPWGTGLTTTAGAPVAITNAVAFTMLDAAHAFVVGNEPTSGLTHTFTLNSTGATEVPTKVPHMNAGAIASPMGSSVLFFGGANELESFTPAQPTP